MDEFDALAEQAMFPWLDQDTRNAEADDLLLDHFEDSDDFDDSDDFQYGDDLDDLRDEMMDDDPRNEFFDDPNDF